MTRPEAIDSTFPAPVMPSIDRWLLLGGLFGPVLFILAWTVGDLTRPGYSWVDQAISDLGIGDGAWMLNGSLVILGLTLVGFAIAFYRTFRALASPAYRVACAVLLACVGAGYAVAGIFDETKPMHWEVGAPLVYAGAIFGFIIAGRMLRRSPLWGWWGTLSLLASAATLVLVVATFYTFSMYTYSGFTPVTGHFAGLMERILFVEILAWFAALGWRLFRGSQSLL